MLERFMTDPDEPLPAQGPIIERTANGMGSKGSNSGAGALGNRVLDSSGGEGGRRKWRNSANAIKAASRVKMMRNGVGYAVSGNETAPPTVMGDQGQDRFREQLHDSVIYEEAGESEEYEPNSETGIDERL